METTTSWLLTERTDSSNVSYQDNQSFWSNASSSQSISTLLQSSEGFNSTIPSDINESLYTNGFWSNPFYTTEPTSLSEVSGKPAMFFVMVSLRSIVVLVTILANVLVLYAYATTKKLRTYTNYYIVNLAIADLVSGGFLPIRGVYREFSNDWPFSEAFCACFTCVDHIFLHATFLMTLTICYDRFRATNMPLKHLSEKTLRHACMLIFLAYIVPVFLWTTIIIILPYSGAISRVQPPQCYGPYAFYPALLIFTILVLSWVPMISTVILYAFVYCAVIRKGMDKSGVTGKKAVSENKSKGVASEAKSRDPRSKSYRMDTETSERAAVKKLPAEQTRSEGRVHSISAGLSQGLANPAYEETEEDVHRASDQPSLPGPVLTETTPSTGPPRRGSTGAPARFAGRASRRESRLASLRATRTLTYILTTMIVSALPWSVFALWAAIDPLGLPLRYNTVFNYLGWMSHFSSTVNPFCYAVGNPLFKAAFLRILCCRPNTAPRNAEISSDRHSRTSRD
ncbi:muscarinic acetylcholine receptor M5-like [Patiria miniata]|uniref:G-protein coupled receptors family 1 profile domain-containing protein n=1 Tax=Patiria miniata TaxID=46514 RepID=A0A913ZKN7_PATMI|nr:muscarinic acetylcholine receptor M5-like [Patiria miniata]